MPELFLHVNDRDYGGWEDIAVGMTMQGGSGTFQIVHSDRWVDQPTRWPIKRGDKCEVFIGDQPVIDGFVDCMMPTYDAESHVTTVVGRDRTADIIDSSAEPQQFLNQPLDKIAIALCTPCGVNVIVDADVGEPFQKQAVNTGETVFDCIERLARYRGVLLMCDAGRLRITKPSTETVSTALVLGENIKRAQPRFSDEERFNTYTVKSSQPGNDHNFGRAASTPFGHAFDPAIRPTRKKILIAEEASGLAACKDRARRECNVRAGRGNEIVYTVEGWLHNDKELWPVNRLVTVTDEFLGIDNRQLLIVDVMFTENVDNGQETHLTLMPPETFELDTFPEPEEDALF